MNGGPFVGIPGIKEAADLIERQYGLLNFEYPTGVHVLQDHFCSELSEEGKAKVDRGETQLEEGEGKYGCYQIFLSPWELNVCEPEVHLLGMEPVTAQNTGWEEHLQLPEGAVGEREGRLILFHHFWGEIGWTAPQGDHRSVANTILDWFRDIFIPRIDFLLGSGMVQPAANSPIDARPRGEIVGRLGVREYMEGKFGSITYHGASYITHEQHEANEAAQREEAERTRIESACQDLTKSVHEALLPQDLDEVKTWLEKEGFPLDLEEEVRQSWPEPVRRLHVSYQLKHASLERATVAEDEGIPEPPTGGVRVRGSKMSKLQKALLRMEASRNRSERLEEEE